VREASNAFRSLHLTLLEMEEDRIKMQKEIGLKAEYHVIAELNKLGIPNNYIDDWYDIEVEGIKIEIKSACISTRNGKGKNRKGQYRTGRFDFTSEKNRIKQRKANVWICFVARHKLKYLTLGYYPAKKIRQGRYVPLTKVMRYELKTIQEVLQEEGKKISTETEEET
jgi:hypothetical protein